MRAFAAVCLLMIVASPGAAQHLGARMQWQPEIAEQDPSLEQPVEIEILGRAAGPALETLSEATGVSLTVAPEDLDTVGERKLTIISQGLTLKAIMVQLPEALQECHWDIDDSGEEPVYLLHRNAGVEYESLKRELQSEWSARRAEGARRTRATRIEKAVGALELAPEELERLRESDYFLAVAMQDRSVRASLASFRSLPLDLQESFLASGELTVSVEDAPEQVRSNLRLCAEGYFENIISYAQAHPEEVGEEIRDGFEENARSMLAQFLEDELPHSTLTYKDAGVDVGRGILLLVATPGLGEHEFIVAPPRYPDSPSGHPLIPLLLFAGEVDNPTAAETSLRDWHRRRLAASSQLEAGGGQVSPVSDATSVPFAVERMGAIELLELQRLIAEKTALSIISDYVTGSLIPIPSEVHSEQPLWQILSVLSESRTAHAFRWRSVGECLTFHHTWWPVWALTEVPESLIFSSRDRLRVQGRLTLHDLADIYAELAHLPQFQQMLLSWPYDLRAAGCSLNLHTRRALLLYASLSPEQVEKAQGPDGLAVASLSTRQREELTAIAAEPWMGVPTAEAAQILFRVVHRTEQGDGSVSTEEAESEVDQYELILELRSDPERSGRMPIRLPRARAGGENP